MSIGDELIDGFKELADKLESGDTSDIIVVRKSREDLERGMVAVLAAKYGFQVVGPWQPIETVPKDGRAVLLWWVAPVGKPAVVKSRWMCRTHCHDSRPWRCPNEGTCRMEWEGNRAGEFTHWMPVPEGPAA